MCIYKVCWNHHFYCIVLLFRLRAAVDLEKKQVTGSTPVWRQRNSFSALLCGSVVQCWHRRQEAVTSGNKHTTCCMGPIWLEETLEQTNNGRVALTLRLFSQLGVNNCSPTRFSALNSLIFMQNLERNCLAPEGAVKSTSQLTLITSSPVSVAALFASCSAFSDPETWCEPVFLTWIITLWGLSGFKGSHKHIS